MAILIGSFLVLMVLGLPVAVAMADPATGPAEALRLIDDIRGLDGSYLVPSVRGELLSRMGRPGDAAGEFDRAAALAENEAERKVLADKARRARAG